MAVNGEIGEDRKLTFEDHLPLLSSEDASKRAIAGLVLNRSGIASYRELVRELVLEERDPLVLMSLAPSVVGWKDDTLDSLLAKNLDERALFALLESARFQKRAVREERISALVEHESLFVRLAALECALAFGVIVNIADQIARIRAEVDRDDFVERPHQPSPIFTDRAQFLRQLSRLRARVSSRDLNL